MDKDKIKRVRALQKRLKDNNVDAALINYPIDVYYFSGTGNYASLIVPERGDPILAVRININRVKKDSWIEDIRPSKGMKSVIDILKNLDGSVGSLGLAEDVVPLEVVRKLRKGLGNDIDLVDISEDVLAERMIKDGDEIENIEKASEISQMCLESVPELIDSGITEGELQSELEKIKRRNGAEPEMVHRAWNRDNNFGMVASGRNTSVVSGFWITIGGVGMHAGRPWEASTRTLEEGDVFIIDHGTLVNGYHTDEARTYIVGGERSEIREDVEILNECLSVAKDAVKPGVSIGTPYREAKKVAAEYGKEEEFMALGEYGIEYLGHGVGLEIDERPLISPYSHVDTFHEGMTLAIEPKLIYPDDRGVTLEDTVLVTSNGIRTLTSTPRGLISC